MKSINAEYIRDIKKEMAKVRESLKKVENAEKIQDKAKCLKEYETAQLEAQDACSDIMEAMKEMVKLASTMGCINGLFEVSKYHQVVEIDSNDLVK